MNNKETLSDEERSELLNCLKWYRAEERHEIKWIGDRMNWLLLSQTFLILAVVEVHDKAPSIYSLVISLTLSITGLWLNLKGTIAIRAAQYVKDYGWLKRAFDLHVYFLEDFTRYQINRPIHVFYSEDEQKRLDMKQLKFSERIKKDHLHIESMRLHRNICDVLSMVWIIIGSATLASYFVNIDSSHLERPILYFIGSVGSFLFIIVIGIFVLNRKIVLEKLKQEKDRLMERNSEHIK